jgi:hypothetical protein
LAFRCSTDPHTLHPPPREGERERGGRGRERKRERGGKERERERGEREKERGGGETEYKVNPQEHTALTKDKH